MSDVSENPIVQAHRDVVERLWTDPMLERCSSDLPAPTGTTVLAAEARCGAVIDRWLQALPADTRMMALESSGPMLDEARSRIAEKEHQRIFFVEQRVNSLSYADDVFDGACCLHGLVSARQTSEGLAELTRVVSPGASVVVCVPLASSFSEFYDLLDESLRAAGLIDALPRVDEMRADLVTPSDLAYIADETSLEDIEVDELRWDVAFGSGREYLYSPLIQETFFPHWVGAIRSSDRDEILDYITDAIDTYWMEQTLETTVKAGLVTGRKAQ